MLIAVVNQHTQLFRTYFLSSKTEYEQERIDYVRFAWTVRSDDCIETLQFNLIKIM